MIKSYIIFICVFLFAVRAHNNKLQNDADVQSALMPQELNPAFVSNKDEPWQVVLPISRQRRYVEVSLEAPTVGQQVKRYSRIVSCAILALSAVLEIVFYLIEFYYQT